MKFSSVDVYRRIPLDDHVADGEFLKYNQHIVVISDSVTEVTTMVLVTAPGYRQLRET
jgi:hypothetical protein